MKPPEYRYQAFARQKIQSRGKTALLAPPGAGKTRPIIEGVFSRIAPHEAILIICSGPAVATWKRQIPLWLDDTSIADEIHYVSGSALDRRAILASAKHGGIFIMNAAVFRIDFPTIQGISWAAVIADEYHKFMIRRKSQTYEKFLKLTRHIPNTVICTGSGVRRNPSSMFTAFQIIDPIVFRGYWKFVNTYCLVSDGAYGKEIIGVKNQAQLQQRMDHYMAYIPEEVVADQQPKGKRQSLDVEMDEQQEKIYEDLTKHMLSITDEGGVLVASTVLGKLIMLRQLLCCPKILDENLGLGAGFEAVVDKLDEDPHVAIFVPFRPAVGYFVDELRRRGYYAEGLLGGTSPQELQRIIDDLRRKEGVLVCTIQYAESFDFETCKTSYFIGYDYTVDQNQQAEGRTKRAISEHKFVTWNYIKYMNTIDEYLLLKLDEDFRNMRRVLSRPQELIDFLRGITNVDQNN